MGIILDRTRQSWVLKAKIDGKDKRFTLRKWNGESSNPIPPDVVELAARHLPQVPQADSTPLVEFMDNHMAEYKKHKRPASYRRLSKIVETFLAFAAKDRLHNLQSIDSATIRRYFDWRLETSNASPRTTLSDLQLLSGVFSTAKHEKIITDNPISDVVRVLLPSYPQVETTKYLEMAEIKKFIIALESDRQAGKIPDHYADLALVMLSTGLRVSCAIRLEASWINMEHWTITVPPQFDKCKVGYTTAITKGGRAIVARRMEAIGGKGRLFPDSTTGDSSYHHIRRTAQRHGVDFKGGAYNHALRHTLATSLVDADVPIQVIAGLLGQRNLKTTQRYAKVRDQAKIKAIQKLDF